MDDEAANEEEEVVPAPNEGPPSLQYATKYWIPHAKDATSDLVQSFDPTHPFWDADSTARANWWREYRTLDSDWEDLDYMPALHLASAFGYSALLEALVESAHSDELTKYDSWGLPALYWASSKGSLEAVQKLLKAGARIDEGRDGVKNQITPLFGAAIRGKLDIVKYLVSKGARIDVPDEDDGTALYGAAEASFPDIVEYLLDNNADPNLELGYHRTALAVAAYGRFDDVVDLLLHRAAQADPEGLSCHYGSALGAACRMG